jgi:hypothetical protein
MTNPLTPIFSAAPKPTNPAPRIRVCPECHGQFPLPLRELLPDHNQQTVGPGGVLGDNGRHCDGSGQQYVGWK